MSLSRAFTTRRANKGSTDMGEGGIKLPFRSNTVHKAASQQAMRHKISGPMELVHTTNMLSYNAPDVPRMPSRSNTVSTRSTTEGDYSDNLAADSPASTPPTSPDGERGGSPVVEPNHLSCYFMAPSAGVNIANMNRKHAASASTSTTATTPSTAPGDPPAIPKRSPSRTRKQSFDAALGRKHSISHMSKASDHSSHNSTTFSRPSSTSTRASSVSHASMLQTLKQQVPPPPMPQSQAAAPPPLMPKPSVRSNASIGPFGQELAQVSELAEEFASSARAGGAKLDIIHEDEQYMNSRGLAKRTVDDYLYDIQSLMATFWPTVDHHSKKSTPMWI
ncbi:hypothetical protein GMORB2_5753 [Geosmithia morbida]|uniref:Uncharacterized protein n=1 Tax=Geosmithia morbida TaxID=1094350 RepID=A0A9P5D2M7_9HYPO|nr:uncharacterized protein GMORB2_5753 [Geosmithia morbida]KAF4124037.1 hypothetical protein GMORB2_5753 [Geosmithia morbida]